MCLTITQDGDTHSRTHRAIAHLTDQAAGIGHFNAVKGFNHVTGLEPRFTRRAFWYIGDQRAHGFLQTHGIGHIIGHILDANAKPAAAGLAELFQLVDHPCHHVGGHRKADPDGAAIGGQNGGVHADHFAIHIEQRPA